MRILPAAAAMAAVYAIAFWRLGGWSINAPFPLIAAFGIVLLWASVEDLATQSIPITALVAATGLGLSLVLALSFPLWLHVVSALAYGAGTYGLGQLISHYRGALALGLADVWLIALAALLLGPLEPITVILIASLAAIVWLGLRRLVSKAPLAAPLPFGPFLATAIWLVFLEPGLVV